MSEHYFKMYPKNPNLSLENQEALCEVLREIGLISNAIEWYGQKRFKIGSRFFELFDDKEGTIKPEFVSCDASYSIRIITSDEMRPMVLDGAEYAQAPSCPNCDYRHSNFGVIVSQWWENPNEYLWRCPNCQHDYPIQQLNWHYSMGFAKYAIEILNIGWHQVIPNNVLLDALKAFAGTDFSYIYGRL